MKYGVLLGNLGSPKSYAGKDVRSYLYQFLTDKFVINIFFITRWLLVHCIIVPFRYKKSAEAYKSIWTVEGSPLVRYTYKQAHKLEDLLNMPVSVGMRYGEPSIQNSIQELKKKQVESILVFPLYPQFAMSSYTTFVEEVKKGMKKEKITSYKIAPIFYDDMRYLQVLTNSIQPYIKGIDLLLFSFHGLPESHIYKVDTFGNCKIDDECCSKESFSKKTCYRAQSYFIANTVANKLNLDKEQFMVSFQSRLGREPWLQPFTDIVLEELPKKGIKKIAVVCPAFISDCLETLEEIQIRGKESFLEHGGEEFTYIPCLNDNNNWIVTLSNLIKEGYHESF